MKSLAPRAQRLLACLGDPSRFRVISALVEGERCVTDLAGRVGLSQSCTTRHLQALLRERMVRRNRDGKRVFFGICTEDALVRELIDLALRSAGPLPADFGDGAGRPHTNSARPPVSDSPHAGSDQEPARDLATVPDLGTDLDDYLL